MELTSIDYLSKLILTELVLCVFSPLIVLGIGYNGFPRGCSDDKLPWAKVGGI